MMLAGKRILLGVTGSISAYKSAEIIRLLSKQGADVQVVMTSAAKEFITPLTLSTLSGKPVLSAFSEPKSGQWNNHVDLGINSDALLIAPASANTIAKMAHGYCEDLLSAIYLSARCPVFIAPAMDVDMFRHDSTTSNLEILKSRGAFIIGPESGPLASGINGVGRLTEPADIVQFVSCYISEDPAFLGKRVLITAGPTREPIDPVRFISNNSSGKMGLALAGELINRGAAVTLVYGPGVKPEPRENLRLHQVTTAAEMHRDCMGLFADSEIVIMAAAVADFTPEITSDLKIKKGKDRQAQSISLKPTADILAEMGNMKSGNQILVGFALETHNEMIHAKSKLNDKNLDLIVLNSLKDFGAGFETDTNKITIISKDGSVTGYDLKSKKTVAVDIIEQIRKLISLK